MVDKTKLEDIVNTLSKQIPKEYMMAVPIMLLMIDTKTWQFSQPFSCPELHQIADVIENSEDLKQLFSTRDSA